MSEESKTQSSTQPDISEPEITQPVETPATSSEEQAKELVGATKGRNWLPIIIIIIVLLLLGGGVVAGMTIFKDQIPFLVAKPTSKPEPVVLPISTPTPIPAPTADWKGYQNDKYGYAIKIPRSWEAKVQKENPELTIIGAPDKTSLEILSTKTKEKDLISYLNNYDEMSKTAFEGQPSIEVLESQKIFLGGVEAIQRKEELLAAGFITTKTYTMIGSYVYSFMILPNTSSDLPKSEVGKNYSLVLSTFNLLADWEEVN